MGLDTVELVMNVEEAFGVTLCDDDAVDIRTVGDLYQCVMSKRDATEGCLSSELFYKLRQEFVTEVGCARRDVCPTASLDRLVPVRMRRRLWRRLRAHQVIETSRLPELVLPWQLRRALRSSFWEVTLWAFIWLATAIGIMHALSLTMVAGLLVFVTGFSLTRCFAVSFPPQVVTMRDLTLSLLSPGCDDAARDPSLDDPKSAWLILQGIVAEQLDVEREDVTPSARFVEDLGAG